MFSSHTRALLQALLVTFIWSLSWVLIKIGLRDIPSLTFAGLRYGIAALCLLSVALSRPAARQQLRGLTRAQWGQLVALGVVLYAITQGAQFAALDYLPAVTLSLMLNVTTILVALVGLLIGERPNGWQWLGIAMFIIGAVIYFGPGALPAAGIGLVIGGVGVLANAAAAVMGRHLNRTRHLSALVVTVVSMGVGSALLLATGVTVQGFPPLAARAWLIIVWLAVVHTAFAFTLWNVTLQRLQAFESSLINNTMLIQIAILAWVFLGERITQTGVIGLFFAVVGTLIVQLRRPQPLRKKTPVADKNMS